MDINQTELNQSQEESSLFSFDKRVLFLSLKSKIILILIVSIAATIIGFVYAKVSIKNKWQARCVLLRHKKNMASSADMPYLYQELDYNTVLQSVKMRKNLQTVIDSLKLQTTPERLYGSVSVKRGGRANIINILATHKEREKAVNISNLLAEVFINSYVNILNSSAVKIYKYYESEKSAYKQKLESSEEKLEEFRSKHQILSLEKETQNKYDNLRTLELELMNHQLNITALETKINDIAERITDLPDKVELHSTVSASYQKQLQELKNQLAVLKKKYTEKNPKIVKLQNEIDALENSGASTSAEDMIPDQITYGESQLKKSLQLEQAQYENELNSSIKKIEDYQARIQQIKEELKSLSPLEREYFDITNNKATMRKQLEWIENRLINVRIAIDSNVSDFEILERAVPPKYPEASGRKLMAIVFGTLAFVGLTLYFAGKEILDFSVKSDVDFKEVLKIKLLGEIPNKDSVLTPVFYSQTQILYGQFQALLPDKKTPIVTIGSDSLETGSSFIIQEMSELLISQNKKILWIESLTENHEEISEFVINNQLYSSSKIINTDYNTISEQLHKAYFLFDESTFKKILNKSQLDSFFAQLAEYDVIFWEMFDVHFNLQLFTTIISSSDLLAFVARFRHSNRTQLQNAIQFLKENTKVPIVGILNDTKKPYFKIQY